MDRLSDELDPVLDVPAVVALEQRIAAAGTPLSTLMSRAGEAVAEAVADERPMPARVCVLVGSGNNGGDGWVAARLLAEEGYDVDLVTRIPASQITAEPASDAALRTAELADSADVDLAGSLMVVVNPAPEDLASILADADVVVDAILGTGFSGEEVREPYATWIRMANDMHERVEDQMSVAVDVPSGLSAQSGDDADPTFKANVTVTMLAAKPGLVGIGTDDAVGRVMRAPLEIEDDFVRGFEA